MDPINKLKEHMEVSGGWSISRRYAVMNGFDGILTVLGLVIGSFLLEVDEAKYVILPGVGACIAIGVSGFWIAFLTEEAEQAHEQANLEKMIFTDLDHTLISDSAKTAALVNSIIDGASPFIMGVTVLIPFYFASASWISINAAYYTTFIVASLLLFILGTLLGKFSEKNKVFFGLKTLFAGIVIAFLILILEFL